MARILDAKTVLVGMRPAVAITLVNWACFGVSTALNVERGGVAGHEQEGTDNVAQ
jgi:rsbT antagonist protein RsbS